MLFAWIFRKRLPTGLIGPFVPAAGPGIFLATWCLIGWLSFMLLIPAASLWLHRAYLGVIGPGVIFTSILFAASGRLVHRRLSIPVGCALFLMFIYGNSRAGYSWTREPDKTVRGLELIDYMRTWPVK